MIGSIEPKIIILKKGEISVKTSIHLTLWKEFLILMMLSQKLVSPVEGQPLQQKDQEKIERPKKI